MIYNMTSFIFKAVIISVISFVYKLYKNIKLTIFDILNNNSIITVIKNSIISFIDVLWLLIRSTSFLINSFSSVLL